MTALPLGHLTGMYLHPTSDLPSFLAMVAKHLAADGTQKNGSQKFT